MPSPKTGRASSQLHVCATNPPLAMVAVMLSAHVLAVLAAKTGPAQTVLRYEKHKDLNIVVATVIPVLLLALTIPGSTTLSKAVKKARRDGEKRFARIWIAAGAVLVAALAILLWNPGRVDRPMGYR